MNKFNFFYNAIIRNYMAILTGILFSFMAIMIVFVMLLQIKAFFNYYANITAGFVPELRVRFDPAITEDNMLRLIDEIESSNPSGYFQYGYFRNFDNASFLLDPGPGASERRSFEKNITVIGFNYNGDRKIELFQNGKAVIAEVLHIDHFGEWLINIEKHDALAEVETYIVFGGRRIYFEPIDFGGFYTLMLQNSGDPVQLMGLYDFLIDYASRFINLQNMGISSNRFEIDSAGSGDTYNMQVFVKRNLLACFNLVFSQQGEATIALLSSPLYSGISRYSQVRNTTLDAGGKNTKLLVVDFFNIHTEQFYSDDIILMNYLDFSSIFDTNGTMNLLYIYGDKVPGNAIAKKIASNYPNVELTFRHDAISTLLIQEKIVKYGIYGLLGLFFTVVCCIVTIRLLKFYMVFQYELIFLKTYGYEKAVFTRMLLAIFFIGSVCAWLSINYLIMIYNQILARYYYPEVTLDPLSFGIPLLMCAGILSGAYVLERIQIANLEYGNRGDIT